MGRRVPTHTSGQQVPSAELCVLHPFPDSLARVGKTNSIFQIFFFPKLPRQVVLILERTLWYNISGLEVPCFSQACTRSQLASREAGASSTEGESRREQIRTYQAMADEGGAGDGFDFEALDDDSSELSALVTATPSSSVTGEEGAGMDGLSTEEEGAMSAGMIGGLASSLGALCPQFITVLSDFGETEKLIIEGLPLHVHARRQSRRTVRAPVLTLCVLQVTRCCCMH